jgi:hypothetical protein
MGVDIDRAGSSSERQHDRGMAVLIEHVPIGLADGVRDGPVAHRTAVDEEILHSPVARGRYGRQPQPARQPQTGRATVDPHAGRAEFSAAQLRQPPGAGFPVGRRLQAQYRALVVPEVEPDREPAQRQTADPSSI